MRLLMFGWRSLLTLAMIAVPCAVACGPESNTDDESEGASSSNLTEGAAIDCSLTATTGYDDGKPYPVDVVHIGEKAVVVATAHAYLKMKAAADEAGADLEINSGFRTQEEQQRLYNCYVKKNCNDGNLAARPGYSNHQNGRALDLTTSTWLAKNAEKFGFRRTVPSEAWHYEFFGADPGGPCGSAATKSDDAGTTTTPSTAPPPRTTPDTDPNTCVTDFNCPLDKVCSPTTHTCVLPAVPPLPLPVPQPVTPPPAATDQDAGALDKHATDKTPPKTETPSEDPAADPNAPSARNAEEEKPPPAKKTSDKSKAAASGCSASPSQGAGDGLAIGFAIAAVLAGRRRRKR